MLADVEEKLQGLKDKLIGLKSKSALAKEQEAKLLVDLGGVTEEQLRSELKSVEVEETSISSEVLVIEKALKEVL